MKKAEMLPKHPVLQQVGTFDILRTFLKNEWALQTPKILLLIINNPHFHLLTGCFHCALLRFLTDPFDRSNPSPSYFNPVPWKPIHIPPPEKPMEESCSRKPLPLKQQRSKQSPSTAFRLRASASPGQFQRRWLSRTTAVTVRNSFSGVTETTASFLEHRIFLYDLLDVLWIDLC